MAKVKPAESGIKTDRFSLENYRKILTRAKRSGYEFPRLSEFKNWLDRYPRFLLLRHDVDISPLNALEMAKIEHSLGIISAYYVRLRSVFYNPAASPHYESLAEIADMGHEVGLHYDCRFYEDKGIDIDKGIGDEAKALEGILGIKVMSVSQHRPAVKMRFHKPSSYVDAYDSELLDKATYVSESGFKWRERTLDELVGTAPRIYALVHPDTWVHAGMDMPASYGKTAQALQDLIGRECSEFIDSTYDYLKKREAKEIR